MLNLKLHLFNFKKELDFESQDEVAQIVESHFNGCDNHSEKTIIKSLNDKLSSYSYDKSVQSLLETINTDLSSYELSYNIKDLYKIVEKKNQGGDMYRPALNTILGIINTETNEDKMVKILDELSMHSWIPEVNLFVANLTKSPEKRINLLSSGKSEPVYTIVETVENGHMAFIQDSWFLLKDDTIEKSLLEDNVKDVEKLNILRNLQVAMKYATVSEDRIDFRISENLTIGIPTKKGGAFYINNEQTNKETTLETLFQSPIIPIVNKNFFPLIKEVAANVDMFVELDVVRKIENLTNPFLSLYAFNYKENIYTYRVDSRYGNTLFKYESANELINEIKNELSFDLTYFYENKISKEMKFRKALEDKERQIKLDLTDIDKNIDKVEANVKMIGESEVLTKALNLLTEKRNELEAELKGVKELQYNERLAL